MARHTTGPFAGQPFDVRPETERAFWACVQKSDGCWLWTGARNTGGYGTMHVPGFRVGPVHAHRIAYRLTNGPIPRAMCVLHVCDVPQCVRPEHLRLGTHFDNMRDMREKGRARNGRADQAFCKHGHAFTPANTRHTSSGGRQCRTCEARHAADANARRAAVRYDALAAVRTRIEALVPALGPALAGRINARAAHILRAAFGAHGHAVMTLTELGVEYGVTRERARQVLERSLELLDIDVRGVRGKRSGAARIAAQDRRDSPQEAAA